MNEYFRYEFEKLEEWARGVSQILGSGFDILGKREQILENAILCTTFDVDTDLPSPEITSTILKVSEKYKRGRRFFFLFDKRKKFLFLLFYPYYIVCDETR